MSVENVKQCRVKYYLRPKPGNLKLGVEVRIVGIADSGVLVGKDYAKVTDDEGHVYLAGVGGCTPELASTTLAKEDRATGWLTFEVPETAQNLKLGYATASAGKPVEELIFALGEIPKL